MPARRLTPQGVRRGRRGADPPGHQMWPPQRCPTAAAPADRAWPVPPDTPGARTGPDAEARQALGQLSPWWEASATRHADGAHAPPMLGARSRVGGGRPHGARRLGRQRRGPALPPPSATRRADRPGGSSRLGPVSAWTVTVSGRVTSRPRARPPPGNRGGHGDTARSVSHIQEPKAQTWAAGRAAPGWPHAGSVLSPGHVQEETSLTLPSGRSVPGPPGAQGRPRRTRREPGRHHS